MTDYEERAGDIFEQWTKSVSSDPGHYISLIAAALAEFAADARRETAKSYGACMSCLDGAPDPYGCTDCLGTGYDGGAPKGFVSEDFLKQALAKSAEEMRERCEAIAQQVASETTSKLGDAAARGIVRRIAALKAAGEK